MSGTVPCTTEGSNFCRAIIPHPELSTSGDLLVSYFDPVRRPVTAAGWQFLMAGSLEYRLCDSQPFAPVAARRPRDSMVTH